MGEAGEAQRLPDAAGGRAAGRLAARFSLKEFLAREDGATAVEYSLIVACIFLAIVGAFTTFASNANTMYTHISTAVSGATR